MVGISNLPIMARRDISVSLRCMLVAYYQNSNSVPTIRVVTRNMKSIKLLIIAIIFIIFTFNYSYADIGMSVQELYESILLNYPGYNWAITGNCNRKSWIISESVEYANNNCVNGPCCTNARPSIYCGDNYSSQNIIVTWRETGYGCYGTIPYHTIKTVTYKTSTIQSIESDKNTGIPNTNCLTF